MQNYSATGMMSTRLQKRKAKAERIRLLIHANMMRLSMTTRPTTGR